MMSDDDNEAEGSTAGPIVVAESTRQRKKRRLSGRRKGKTGAHVLRRESRAALQEANEDKDEDAVELQEDASNHPALVAQAALADIATDSAGAGANLARFSSQGSENMRLLPCVSGSGSESALQQGILQLAAAFPLPEFEDAESNDRGIPEVPASAYETHQFCKQVLRSGPRPHTSWVADAKALDMEVRTFKRHLTSVAAAAHLSSAALWSRHCRVLGQKTADGDIRPLALIRHRVYDETPLRLRVASSDSADGPAERSLAKVLQTRFKIGILLQHVPTGQISFHHALLHVPLQALETTTGEDLALAQIQLHSLLRDVEVFGAEFDLRLNVATADRYSGNLRAEEILHAIQPQDVPSRFPCQVHDASRAMSWQMGLASTTITGMISAALVLSSAGSMARFRKILAEEIEAKLSLHFGQIPEGALQEHRYAVYDLFLSLNLSRATELRAYRHRRTIQRKVLDYFVAMDIQNKTSFQLCTRGHVVDPGSAMRLVRQFVIPALVPEPLKVFARHRWFGGELSVDWCGLLESHHTMECSNRFFSAWFHQRAPWRHIAVTICPLATLTVKLRMRRLAGTAWQQPCSTFMGKEKLWSRRRLGAFMPAKQRQALMPWLSSTRLPRPRCDSGFVPPTSAYSHC